MTGPGASSLRLGDFSATWLTLPGLMLISVGFAVPVSILLAESFTEPPGGLAHYQTLFGSLALLNILWRSVWTSLIVTVVCLLLGYPFAYVAATTGPRARMVLIGIIAGSLFISLVVRCYAWLAILDRGGVLNATLLLLGLQNLQIVAVHNFAGVVIGVTQFTLPFMILSIFDVMRRVDERLLLASAILGAAPLRTFLHIYLPLTMPGVFAGCAIVFITTLGYYIAPSILGGPQNVMIGELIATKIRTTVEWGLGTAIASVLLVVAVAFFIFFYRAVGRYKEVGHA